MENKANGSNGEKEVMTPQEVSRYLKLPLSTVYKLSQEGRIRATKLGKHWRYLRYDIERYLKGNSTHTHEAPQISFVERRRFPRTRCSIPSHFEVDIPRLKHCEGNGVIRDLSPGGALLEINEVKLEGQFIRVDDPILIHFDSGILKMKIGENEIQGRIVRLHENAKTKVGVEFAPLTAEMNQAIAALVGGIASA